MRSRACEKGRSFHSGLRFLFRQPVPFEGEQELFARQTAGVTGQLAARTDDPMAGNDDRNRIVIVGTAYGPRSLRITCPTGDFAVSHGLSIRNFREDLPNFLPIRGSLRFKRQIERGAFSGEIFIQLFRRPLEQEGRMPDGMPGELFFEENVGDGPTVLDDSDYEGENETYIEASVENSSSILYDKEIRNKPRTRRTKRNV